MNTVPLFNVRGSDVQTAGVKGAQVGELMSVGLPVPNGFVVTTDAYRVFMEESGLRKEIESMLSQIKVPVHERLVSVSASIQSKSQQVSIGGKLEKEIFENLDALGAEYVAVRSSPAVITEGDPPQCTLRLATSLNVSREKVLGNVHHCWFSLYVAKALEYVYEQKVDPLDIAVAVVVQQMADAEVSGVCFTEDPKNQDNEKLYIEAGWGLGEAMVSGVVSPDRCSVNKKTLKLGTYTIGTQLKEVVREEHLPRLVDVPKEKQQKRKLENEDITTLARLCLDIEEYYGSPQEVEWAYDGEHFFVLQARKMR